MSTRQGFQEIHAHTNNVGRRRVIIVFTRYQLIEIERLPHHVHYWLL